MNAAGSIKRCRKKFTWKTEFHYTRVIDCQIHYLVAFCGLLLLTSHKTPVFYDYFILYRLLIISTPKYLLELIIHIVRKQTIWLRLGDDSILQIVSIKSDVVIIINLLGSESRKIRFTYHGDLRFLRNL